MSEDREQRRQAAEETGRSFLVEASAGTGKTSVLIRRMLHCILERGPDEDPIPLSRICAITFTEKAAGEMKLRLRQELEKRTTREDEIGNRARKALEELESASISTFHAFAVSILKERPIEAGLDPHFKPLDELQSQLLFEEVWEVWLHKAIQERKPALEAALRFQVSLNALHAAADTIRRHGHQIRRLNFPEPPSGEETDRKLSELRRTGCDYLKRAVDRTDKLALYLEAALEWLGNPTGDIVPEKPGNKGAAANWRGGKDDVVEIRDYIRTIVEFRAKWLLLPGLRILDAAIRLLIAECLPEWEKFKRERGFLDFDDLLWSALELLKSSRAAREEFRSRYAALLVDEFQDTDPVQWDIIRILASDDSSQEPGEGIIAPGRLFIVGDPKQSIYRFRGADIETYGAIADANSMARIGLERLELTANFRSVPTILSFVDEAFRDVMKRSAEAPYQPEYLAFGGRGERAGFTEHCCVHVLGDRDPGGALIGSGPDFSMLESRRIARLILDMCGGRGWQVKDSSGWRAPRLKDIAILLPVLSRADDLENELRECSIPYALEGGKFYYKRSEVSSAINVLRALANPNDGVALYGALRSIFFGISDEELLRSKLSGLPLDYREEIPETSMLRRPFEILRELHRRRHERSAAETLERLFQQTGAREVLIARGMQSIANLNKLVRMLRLLQQDRTFSDAIELVSGMDEELISETESRIMEEHGNAVRILSIHRAKGLDFPIVIIAGLGIERRKRSSDFLADPHGLRTCAIRVGSKTAGLQTCNFDELTKIEKLHEKAELARLLYVALTRARDHMVVCLHTKGKQPADGSPRVPTFTSTRLEPLAEFLSGIGKTIPESIVNFIDADALPSGVHEASIPKAPTWSASLLFEQYRNLDRLIRETPAGLGLHAVTEDPDHKTVEDIGAAPALAGALRIGIAFHEAMDWADLESRTGARELAVRAGECHGLDESAVRELETMLVNTLESSLLERVRKAWIAGARVCRELPYLRRSGSKDPGIEEGKIDLLFQEDGGWILVDYKTNRIPKDMDAAFYLQGRYAAQVQAYVAGLKSLGIIVNEAYLLHAVTGAQIPIPIDGNQKLR
jgi:ATP-dependent helicase/nuclease subunit A